MKPEGVPVAIPEELFGAIPAGSWSRKRRRTDAAAVRSKSLWKAATCEVGFGFSLYKILFHFKAFFGEPMILL